MRVAAITILLCLLLQACGSKGPLVLPDEKNSGARSSSNKQEK